MNGSNYVPVPYSPVEAYSASNDAMIPSGGTAVGGVYYDWNDGGFIGVGWFTEIETGPMREFDSGDEVIKYLDDLVALGQDRNLNEVFAAWQDYIVNAGYELGKQYMRNFEDQVYSRGGDGCVHH